MKIDERVTKEILNNIPDEGEVFYLIEPQPGPKELDSIAWYIGAVMEYRNGSTTVKAEISPENRTWEDLKRLILGWFAEVGNTCMRRLDPIAGAYIKVRSYERTA